MNTTPSVPEHIHAVIQAKEAREAREDVARQREQNAAYERLEQALLVHDRLMRALWFALVIVVVALVTAVLCWP